MVIIPRGDGRGRDITIRSKLTVPSPQAAMTPVMVMVVMVVVVVRGASIMNTTSYKYDRYFNEISTSHAILTAEPRLTQLLHRMERIPTAILFERIRTVENNGQKAVKYALLPWLFRHSLRLHCYQRQWSLHQRTHPFPHVGRHQTGNQRDCHRSSRGPFATLQTL
jgi:hypothetical protein